MRYWLYAPVEATYIPPEEPLARECLRVTPLALFGSSLGDQQDHMN